MDLLKLDSFAFKHNGVMGGACIDLVDFNKNSTHWVKILAKFEERLAEKKLMLQVLGLQDAFPFACPTQQDLEANRAVVMTGGDYMDTPNLFTTKWHQNLQARSTFYDHHPSRTPGDTLQIAVHVRRGDYDPCFRYTATKYLPNEYYLAALDEYLPRICTNAGKTCNVTIYSDDTSYRRTREPAEDFAPFIDRNYTMDFTSTPQEVWRAFVQADALFVSRSSFSFVPAIFNRNQVVFPHDYYELYSLDVPYWSIPPLRVRSASDAAMQALREKRCSTEDENGNGQ